MILVPGVFIATYLVLNHQTQLRGKAASNCDSAVMIQVSADGKNFGSSITLPAGVPTKYYIKVAPNCSTNFDAYSNRCESNGSNCKPWNTTSPWGTYRSDDKGVLRADLDNAWPDNLQINMKLRPTGRADLAWSNPIKITFSKTAANTQESINMLDYVKMVPGWTYIYYTNSFSFKENRWQEGKTRLQMEQQITKRKGTASEIDLIPWRFTKSNKYVYWGPGNELDLRWFIVDPTQDTSKFRDYVWGFGHTLYNRWPTDPIRDIQFNSSTQTKIYQTIIESAIPHYNLTRKNLTYLPYINYLKGITSVTNQGKNANITDGSFVGGSGGGSWKIRIEKDYINIFSGPGGFNYAGEAIRMDQYEGQTPMETEDLLRESWYFVKGIGLVEIRSKIYNNYGDINNSKVLNCADDSDCWSDTIKDQFLVMTLGQVFQNPVLTVTVSKDGKSYSGSIDTTQAQGYYLKVSPAYTGYLESTSDGSNVKRWLWVENGIVQVPNPGNTGTYNVKFRVWIPNELGPGESRGPSPTSIQWSNQVTVKVSSSTAANCKSDNFYSGYNYSGLNWCPANNQLCATNWIKYPQVSVSCGKQRIKNYGTYCTKSDGTKSFTGTSVCVD